MLLLERSRNLKGLLVCRASLSGNSPVRLLPLQSTLQPEKLPPEAAESLLQADCRLPGCMQHGCMGHAAV